MCLCESVSLKMSTITQIATDSISGLLKPQQLTLYVEAEVYCLLMNKTLYLKRKKKMSAHFFVRLMSSLRVYSGLLCLFLFSPLWFTPLIISPLDLFFLYFHRNLWLVSRVCENTSVCLHVCVWDEAGGPG